MCLVLLYLKGHIHTTEWSLSQPVEADDEGAGTVSENTLVFDPDDVPEHSLAKDRPADERPARPPAFSPVGLKQFPYSTDKIFAGKGGQTQVSVDGRKRLISAAFVPTLNWYYVEEVDLARLIRLSKTKL